MWLYFDKYKLGQHMISNWEFSWFGINLLRTALDDFFLKVLSREIKGTELVTVSII